VTTSRRRGFSPDSIRIFLAVYTTVQGLLLILFFGLLPHFTTKINSDDALNIVELILPLLSGQVGLLVGFYFGTEKAVQ
jgi:hypothetical protein